VVIVGYLVWVGISRGPNPSPEEEQEEWIGMKIITNNVPREVIYDYELSVKEQEEFDYLDWAAIEDGSDGASFIRYKNELYDLSEFMSTRGLPEFNPLRKWDGYHSDSFFSGIVLKWCDDPDYVIVGRFLT